jgi:ribosome-binding factor A
MTQRTDRIDELLRQEIGRALERDVTDPRIGFVTVTQVETVPDLSRAKVWVSIIGTDDEKKQTLTALRSAMPFIRHSLNDKIRIRRIPEFEVRMDDSVQRGSRVLQIINDLNAGLDPDADAPKTESLPTPVVRLRHEGDNPDELPAIPPFPEGSSKPRPRNQRHADGGVRSYGSAGSGGKGAHGKGTYSGKPTSRRKPK